MDTRLLIDVQKGRSMGILMSGCVAFLYTSNILNFPLKEAVQILNWDWRRVGKVFFGSLELCKKVFAWLQTTKLLVRGGWWAGGRCVRWNCGWLRPVQLKLGLDWAWQLLSKIQCTNWCTMLKIWRNYFPYNAMYRFLCIKYFA